MITVPVQPFGLGDIIFTQTLAHTIAEGDKIVWPVFPQFVEGLNRAYPHITFVDWKTFPIDYDRKDQYEKDVPGYGPCTMLPFRWADTLLQVPYSQCMRAKYDLYGLEWQTWKDKAMWLRDGLKELELNALLGKPKDYNLVNKTFGSDSQLKADIRVDGIEIKNIGSFSLFNWRQLIQGATEIHTVSTSIIYMLEMLDLKAKEVHLYPRRPIEQDFRNIDYILQKHKYIFHL